MKTDNSLNANSLSRDYDLDYVNDALIHAPESNLSNETLSFLNTVATTMVNELEPVRISTKPQFSYFSGNPLAVALGFFQQISNDLAYDKIQHLLNNSDACSVQLNIGNQSRGVVNVEGNRTDIRVETTNTSEDIFVSIHELAHTLDLDPTTSNGSNPTRDTLGEVAPIVYELIASQELVGSTAINLNDSQQITEQLSQIMYLDTLESAVRLALVKKQRNNWSGRVDRYDLADQINDLGVDNTTIATLIDRAESHFKTGYKPYRYMIAQLLAPTIYNDYTTNQSETLANLNAFQSAVSNNDLSTALTSIGLKINHLDLGQLIETVNCFNNAYAKIAI